MDQYHALLRDVIDTGEDRGDRTGTGTRSVFGRSARFDLREGFPLLTTKFVPLRVVAAELLWFISGSTSIMPLLRDRCRIWTDWPLAKYCDAIGARISQDEFEQGLLSGRIDEKWAELGPVYGKQWRRWQGREGHIDQLGEAIDLIRHNPESRRILVDAWNPADLPFQALPPCHFAFQFYCHSDGGLSLQFHMRSTDIFLGLPFNIASYALLLEMVATITDRQARELIVTMGDLHLYSNHFEQAERLLSREPRLRPTIQLPAHSYLEDFTLDEITNGLIGYDPHRAIPAPVAV